MTIIIQKCILLPSYEEVVAQKPKEAQEHLSAEELKSHIGEMPNTFLALKQLEDVQKNLEQSPVGFLLVLLVRLFPG